MKTVRVRIRRAIPKDLAQVAQHYGPGDSPWDPFSDPERLEGIPLEGLLVAEVDGEYAGFLYWFTAERPWFDPTVSRYAHIVEVQVVEEHRGKGIGRALLEHALKRLREEGIEAVYIDTTEDNEVAQRLYESLGFRPFSRTLHYRLKTGAGNP